ncbi:MAG: hypothetical protein IT290_10355 [Deltaproteobacteria bacterium]|nr:hypothetical protein [Deltaproteobacteria bacterium]
METQIAAPAAAQTSKTPTPAQNALVERAQREMEASLLRSEYKDLVRTIGNKLGIQDFESVMSANLSQRLITDSSDTPLLPFGRREEVLLNGQLRQRIGIAYDRMDVTERQELLSSIMRAERMSLAVVSHPNQAMHIVDTMLAREVRSVFLDREASAGPGSALKVQIPSLVSNRVLSNIQDAQYYTQLGLPERALRSANNAERESHAVQDPLQNRNLQFSALIEQHRISSSQATTLEQAQAIRERRYTLEGLATAVREKSPSLEPAQREKLYQAMRTEIMAVLLDETRAFKGAGAAGEAVRTTVKDIQTHYADFLPQFRDRLAEFLSVDRSSFAARAVAGAKNISLEGLKSDPLDTAACAVGGAAVGFVLGAIPGAAAGGAAGAVVTAPTGPGAAVGGTVGAVSGGVAGGTKGAGAGAAVGGALCVYAVQLAKRGGGQRLSDGWNTGIASSDDPVQIAAGALATISTAFLSFGGLARAGVGSVVSRRTSKGLADLSVSLARELDQAGADIAEQNASREVVQWLRSDAVQGELRDTLRTRQQAITESLTGFAMKSPQERFTERLSNLVSSGASGIGPKQLESLYLLSKVERYDTITRAFGTAMMGTQTAMLAATQLSAMGAIENSNLTQGQKDAMTESGMIALAKVAGGMALFSGAHAALKPRLGNPLSELRLGTPEELARQQYVQRAQELGINREVATELFATRGLVLDEVTGLLDRSYQFHTLQRSGRFVLATEGNVTAAGIDLTNLAGLNQTLTHEGANDVMRLAVTKVEGELSKLSGNVKGGLVMFRDRGPEKGGRFNALVVGADTNQVNQALGKAVAEFEQEIADRGLANLNNPRGAGNGVTLRTATLPVRGNTSPGNLLRELDDSVRGPAAPKSTEVSAAPVASAKPATPVRDSVKELPINPNLTERLDDPWTIAVEAHRQEVRRRSGASISSSQTEWLLGTRQQSFDEITGLYSQAARVSTIRRAQEFSARTGTPHYYVELDLGNLKGLSEINPILGDKALAVASGAFKRALSKVTEGRGHYVALRHGGDEMSAVVGNVTRIEATMAMELAKQEFGVYARSTRVALPGGRNITLAELPHLKQQREPGVRLDPGVAYLDPAEKDLSKIFNIADQQILAARKAAVQ